MKLDSNRSEPRLPTALLYVAGAVAGTPFFFLAFALTPLNGTWLKFVVAALPFTALVALWFLARRPNSGSNVSAGMLPEGAYPPGA